MLSVLAAGSALMMLVKAVISGTRLFGFKSKLHYLLAVLLQASYLTLCFRFLPYKMGMIPRSAQ